MFKLNPKNPRDALQSEGSLWRAVSLLAAAGQLRTALLALRAAGLADAALGFTAVCREAGFGAAPPAAAPGEDAAAAGSGDRVSETSELEDLYPHGNGSGPASAQSRRPPTGGGGGGRAGQVDDVTEGDHLQYVVRLLQAL